MEGDGPMTAETCTAEHWHGMTRYPCGRPVKDEGLCGPHLRGKRAREHAAAMREEKIIEARDRLGRARSAVSRLAKAGVTDAGAVHLECTDDDDPEPPGDACTTCWLVHPEGACDR